MRLGFNRITDNAREALDKLGVVYSVESNGMVTVNTEVWDLEDRDHQLREIRPDDPDIDKRSRAQVTRIMKMNASLYYYLINDHVFRSIVELRKDYSTEPATVLTVSILDDVDEYFQDSVRDRMMRQDTAMH